MTDEQLQLDEAAAAYARVVAAAWSDPEYKRRLVAEPAVVLAEAGMPVPDGVTVHVLEDSERVQHFLIGGPDPDSGLPRRYLAGSPIDERAATDPEFRTRLLADPVTVLTGEGVTLADGVTVRLVECDAATAYLVVPVAPPQLEGGAADDARGFLPGTPAGFFPTATWIGMSRGAPPALPLARAAAAGDTGRLFSPTLGRPAETGEPDDDRP